MLTLKSRKSYLIITDGPTLLNGMTNALFLYYANKKAPMELDFKNKV